MKNFKARQKGFTLVELLASVIVLVAVGSIIAGIITSSLRGTNKTNTVENVRQNGNYALNQISKDIEYALPFDGKNTGLGTPNSDGTIAYITNCPFSPSLTPVPLETHYETIAIQSGSNNNVIKYKCTSSPPELSANGNSLIDTDLVVLKSCSFSCIRSRTTDVPIIKINFSIGPKTSNGLAENSTPPISFETSVTIKNYSK